MTDIDPRQSPESPSASSQAGDPLASLHHMSMTAGLGSNDYVAINVFSVIALLLGIASVAVLLGNIMVLVPLAGLACGIVALWQIGKSGGTQSGKGLAWPGLILSLAFVALLGTLRVREHLSESHATADIGRLVDQFANAVEGSQWDQAWALFSPEFKERIRDNRATFQAALQQIQGIPTGSTTKPTLKLVRIKAGELEFLPSGEVRGKLLLNFENEPQARDLKDVQYRQGEAGWLLDDLPQLFRKPRGEGGPGAE